MNHFRHSGKSSWTGDRHSSRSLLRREAQHRKSRT